MKPSPILTLGLLATVGCMVPMDKPDSGAPPQDDAATAPVSTEVLDARPAAVHEGKSRAQPMLAAIVARSQSIVPIEAPRADWMRTTELFASAELGPVESSMPARGVAHFYGTPRNAKMHLEITGLVPGSYGAYIGKDCTSAAALHDSNPFDRRGVGSVTVRPNEIKVGVVQVDGAGVGELDAAIASVTELTQRALILMPATAEKVDQPQTKVACGPIESVRGS